MRKLEVAGIDIAKSDEFSEKKKVSRWLDVDRYYGRAFVRWAILADLQRFAYSGVDSYGNVVRYQGRLFRRWSDFRKKRNLALIYSFAEILPVGSDMYFLTLTVRHPRNHTYAGQKQAISDIRAAWEVFRKYLLRIEGCRYLRFIEAGSENGYAHIHLIVSVLSSECRKVEKIPEKWVEKCRKIGNSAEICGQNLQKIDSTSEIRNVGAYISKYLSKSLETENKDWKWIEICYRMRLRCVSMDAVSRQYIRRKYCDIGVSGVGEWMPLDAVSAGGDGDVPAGDGMRLHPAVLRLILDGLM